METTTVMIILSVVVLWYLLRRTRRNAYDTQMARQINVAQSGTSLDRVIRDTKVDFVI